MMVPYDIIHAIKDERLRDAAIHVHNGGDTWSGILELIYQACRAQREADLDEAERGDFMVRRTPLVVPSTED